jgi:predicted GNAT family acetyltransferase
METRTMHPFRDLRKNITQSVQPESKTLDKAGKCELGRSDKSSSPMSIGSVSIKEHPQMLIRIEREDNGKKGRFVIYYNDQFAGEMTYVWAGTSKFIIDHTGVEESFSGRGLGKHLVMKSVEYARDTH